MTKTDTKQTKKQWQQPRLQRLGTVRDVAKGPNPLNQANAAKRS